MKKSLFFFAIFIFAGILNSCAPEYPEDNPFFGGDGEQLLSSSSVWHSGGGLYSSSSGTGPISSPSSSSPRVGGLSSSSVPEDGYEEPPIGYYCYCSAFLDGILEGIGYCDYGPSTPNGGGGCFPIYTNEGYNECRANAGVPNSCIPTISSSSTMAIGGPSSSSLNISPSSSSVAADQSSSSSRPSSSSVAASAQSSSSSGCVNPSSYASFNTVTIGGQIWMKENLNYAACNSACYRNDPSYCAEYGRLYDWATAMDLPASCNTTSCASQIKTKHRGICPPGWHIPSNAEWEALLSYAGGGTTAGSNLKAKEGWVYCGPSNSGNTYLCEDTYGFAALPGGYWQPSTFSDAGGKSEWWNGGELSKNEGYMTRLYFIDTGPQLLYSHKDYLHSVRCIQD